MWLPKSSPACPNDAKPAHPIVTWLRYSWWGKILAEHDTEPTEFGGGLLKIAIGTQLLLPIDTFSTSNSFKTLSVLPEWIWGLILVVLGSVHLAALYSNSRVWRSRTAKMGFVIWFSISTTFWLANPSSLGAVVFLFAGLAQGWVSIRLSLPGKSP
jgi:hypothetical protein